MVIKNFRYKKKILSAGEDNFCVKTENGDRGEDGIGSWRQPAAPLRR